MGDDCEPLQHQRRDTFTVVVVGNGEGDLCFARIVAIGGVFADADQCHADIDEERNVTGQPNRDQSLKLTLRDCAPDGEEAVVRRGVAQFTVEVSNGVEMIGTCGNDDCRGAVGQDRRTEDACEDISKEFGRR